MKTHSEIFALIMPLSIKTYVNLVRVTLKRNEYNIFD